MPSAEKTLELSSELRLSVARLARRLRVDRLDPTLSLGQLSALATLDRHGPLSPGELAEQEGVQPPSMTRILAALAGRGLVTRTPHPTDGRQHLVAPTDAARDLLRAERRRRDAWLAVRIAGLSAQEREALHRAAPVIERLAAS